MLTPRDAIRRMGGLPGMFMGARVSYCAGNMIRFSVAADRCLATLQGGATTVRQLMNSCGSSGVSGSQTETVRVRLSAPVNVRSNGAVTAG